ncbi:MAG: glycerol-3-phosphate 1-O-acyltransferase PlsY [Clostridia bacterium]|nr:glycerol-3-phosphate 1-O-acyltransferase PlsY [Clostridia bacterium]
MRYFFSDGMVEWGLSALLLDGTQGAAFFAILIGAFLFCAVTAYLLGSINSAILFSTKLYGYDIRGYGSGNAGMTNMFRTFGKKAGFLTLAGDVAKALISVVIGFLVLGGPGQYIAGFFCLLGHVFPLYYKFKGGKGVIVSAITILLIDPLIFLAVALIFALMFAATQIISASSITAAFFYPLVVYAFNVRSANLAYIFFSLMISFFVIAMHKENIQRLMRKEEKKFTIHKDGDNKEKKAKK